MKQFAMLSVFVVLAAACSPEPKETTAARVDAGEIQTIQPGVIEDSFAVMGTVRPETMATLSARLAGNITSVLVREGDRVHRGQLLLTIDARDLAAQQSRAMAGVAGSESGIGAARAARDGAAAAAQLATTTYERYKVLRDRKSVSTQEFDEVEGRYRAAIAEKERAAQTYEQSRSQHQSASAEVAAASTALSWSRITAPIDGVITARWADPGSQATPGTPLLAIESTQRYRVDASVDDQHVSAIRIGESVAVIARDGRGDARGTVSQLAAAPDAATRSYLAQISLPPDSRLPSGSSVTVRFPLGQRAAITIPRSALIDRGELHEVWTVDRTDVLRLRYVTPGAVSGDRIEILTGLSAGDRIVVDARRPLSDGAQVLHAGSGNRS